MLARIADLAPRRPWAFLAGTVVALATGVGVSLGATDELGVGSTRLADPPPRPVPATAELAVVLGGNGAGADSRVFRVAEGVVRAQVVADPAIEGVKRVGRGREVVLVARFAEDASTADRQQAASRLEESIDPGPLRAGVEGEVARLLDARRKLTGDLWRSELLVLPLALLIVAAAASPLRAPAPALCAALAVCGSLALLRLAGTVADVSLLGFGAAAAVGLVLGLEIPLMLLRRHDDELALADDPTAMRRTVVEGGRAAIWIAVAAALAPLAGLVTPLEQAGSLALGCALAAGLAAAAAIVVVPAWLAALARMGRRGEPLERSLGGSSPVARIAASSVGTVAALVVALAALAALASPLLEAVSAPFAAHTGAVLAIRHDQDSLFPELPVPAAIAAGLCAAVAVAATRRPPLALAGPLPPLVAAAGLGACSFVFERGNLVDALGLERQESLATGAVAIAACALVSVAAGRSAGALVAIRDERRLELSGSEVAEHAATLTLAPALAATLVGAIAAAAMVTTDLYPARELGFALAAGLLFDLILVRAPMLAFAARR
ncbi:MAG: hypothetical protein ACRDK9_14630 [Solirubrobacterales bacterium]